MPGCFSILLTIIVSSIPTAYIDPASISFSDVSIRTVSPSFSDKHLSLTGFNPVRIYAICPVKVQDPLSRNRSLVFCLCNSGPVDSKENCKPVLGRYLKRFKGTSDKYVKFHD